MDERRVELYMEYEPGMKYGYPNADVSDDLSSFQDAGYILQDDEVVVDIDVLPKEAIQEMLRIFEIRTQTVWTDRGVHLYFKKGEINRRKNQVCALGFPIEWKYRRESDGKSHSVCVKRNGIARQIDNPGVRTDVPDIFRINKKFDNLLGYDDGEGRNNALFTHRARIQALKEWKEVLNFINTHVFSTPLPAQEMAVLLRDMAFTPSGQGDEPEVARMLEMKYGIVKYAKSLYFRYQGAFTDNEDILDRLIFQAVGDKQTRYVEEIKKQLDMRVRLIRDNETFVIKFRNGILMDGEFIEVDYDEFTPYSIDVEYDPQAKPVEIVDMYLNNLTEHEPEYRWLLQEVLGHTLVVDKEFKRLLGKFFIFVGSGGNGKGTLLAIIRGILNSKNCSGLSIANLVDERYFVTMKGKLVNLGDDIDDEPINNRQMRQLKNIATCDMVATRELFKQSVDMELTTSLIFTSNTRLKSMEKSEGYKRRVVWLPMYYKPTKLDPLFITKLTTEGSRKYWVRLMVEGYLRLYENHRFTDSPIVTQFNKEYHQENNGAELYLDGADVRKFVGRTPTDVYEEFEAWAEMNDVSGTRRMLSQALEYQFGLKPVKQWNPMSKTQERLYTVVERGSYYTDEACDNASM